MDAEAITEMLRHDREEWSALVGELEAAAGEAVYDDPGSPPWIPRDVYAHLSRWIDHSAAQFERAVAGLDPLPAIEGTDDEINARWQIEDQAITHEEARRRAFAAYDRRRALVESVPSESWTGQLDALAEADGWQHFRDHRSGLNVP